MEEDEVDIDDMETEVVAEDLENDDEESITLEIQDINLGLNADLT